MSIKRVLYVEDDPLNHRITERILKSEGYTMLRAMTGREGIVLAHSEAPDLILMDVGLPDMPGYDVIKEIRQMPNHQTTPIIVLTAEGTTDTYARCVEAGCDGYLRKPFIPRKLIAVINDVKEKQAAN
ncbi:MAG: response regulator [Aggregatilineales bacterium]